MRFKWLFFLVILSLVIGSSALAERRETFLGMQSFGARASVVGGLASPGDASSIYWNPSTILSARQGYSLVYGRNDKFGLKNWFEEQVGFLLPAKGSLRLGGFLAREQVGLKQGIGSGAASNAWKTIQLGFGGAVEVTPKLQVGATLGTVTFAHSSGGDVFSNTAVVANLGLLTDYKALQVGVTMRNLAFSKDMALSPDFGIGLAWHKEDFLLQMELNAAAFPSAAKYALSLRGGMEFAFRPGLSLRLGTGPVQKGQPLGVKVGLGVEMGCLLIDYAYDLQAAGATHNISSGFRF